MDRLWHHAVQTPDAPSYILLQADESQQRRWTFADVWEGTLSVAAALERRGLRGKPAVLIFQPDLDFIAAFLGCMRAGVIPAPVYPPNHPRHLSHIRLLLAAAGPAVLLMDSASAASIERLDALWLKDLRTLRVDWLEDRDERRRLADQCSAPLPALDDLALLQFTSGSTGRPKGVVIDHANLLDNEEVIREGFQHSSDSIVVGWLPLYHDMGLIGNVLQPLYLGCPLIFMAPGTFIQRPIRWLNAISRYRATTSGAPNFAYELCSKAITDRQLEQAASLDLSTWEVAYVGAEPVREATLERFHRRFAPFGFRYEAFYPCYGMAETTLMLTGIDRKRRGSPAETLDAEALGHGRAEPIDDERARVIRIVSCGRVRGKNEIAIVDPDSLQRLPEGRVGEIWARGSSIARCYWDSVEATRQTFRAYDSEGNGPFLRTGDLGYMRNGELFVTGRIKSLLIVNGRNYHPHDIEDTVASAHSAFSPRCAVFDAGENGAPRLVAVQEVTRRARNRIEPEDAARAARKAVALVHGLHLHEVFLTPDRIPLTSSGKVRREACRKALQSGELSTLQLEPV